LEKKKNPKSRPVQDEKMDFEKALAELEDIAVSLENGDLGLEDSLKQFERGIKLAKYCHDRLEEAERKIEILQKGGDGGVEVKSVKAKNDTGEIEDEDEDELQGSLL
jgi:exodeoxyribonuclease VII small subunit